jgi:lipoyl(octanoyl) transferase
MPKTCNNIVLKRWDGLQDYQTTWQAMRNFTEQRTSDSADEIWLLQHYPVFTLGQAGKPEHLLTQSSIPVVKSDRGGQITYHGPGQLIAYLLIDLKRRQLGVRDVVDLMENSVIALLQESGICAYAKKSAPGVYVQRKTHNQLIEHKIAALGLRMRKGCCYHGLALNIDMDLTPFQHINPCGYAGLAVTQVADLLTVKPDWQQVENKLVEQLKKHLHYRHE